MKRVGIIGHFGIGLNLANGQTIKTKIVTEAVERYSEEEALIVDAHGGIKAIFPVILGSLNALKKCKNVILMLTENGLKVSVPILYFFNKFFKRRLHYVVVGGWLPVFLKEKKVLSKCIKSFYMIYVETQNMKTALEKMGFVNVVVMPNCKKLEIVSELYICNKPYKLCTFSRVMKEKGIEDAVEAVKKANLVLGDIVYTLDIYGQIESQQKEWFYSLQENFPEYIKYGGIVKFSQSSQVLRKYFALLFPTYYEGEGFAGTAIDAFSSGVPVLASDWKYNSEVIKDGVNGALFETRNIEQLTDKLIEISKKPDEWNNMKSQCIKEANEYRPEKVMSVLFDNLQ